MHPCLPACFLAYLPTCLLVCSLWKDKFCNKILARRKTTKKYTTYCSLKFRKMIYAKLILRNTNFWKVNNLIFDGKKSCYLNSLWFVKEERCFRVNEKKFNKIRETYSSEPFSKLKVSAIYTIGNPLKNLQTILGTLFIIT